MRRNCATRPTLSLPKLSRCYPEAIRPERDLSRVASHVRADRAYTAQYAGIHGQPIAQGLARGHFVPRCIPPKGTRAQGFTPAPHCTRDARGRAMMPCEFCAASIRAAPKPKGKSLGTPRGGGVGCAPHGVSKTPDHGGGAWGAGEYPRVHRCHERREQERVRAR